VIDVLCRELSRKLFGDRGYISQALFERLYEQGIQLITRLRKNMKNKLMDMTDKLLLRKRAVIESAHDFLKNICQAEHSRHRSIHNFLVNLLAALSAYSFLPHKPSIHGLDRRGAYPIFCVNKIFARRTLSAPQAARYYGRACTPLRGDRKNWKTSCYDMTGSTNFLQPRQASGY
jgi:hypothetical protein